VVARVPLRNVWLLFLYAADLAHFKDKANVNPEEASDLPELIARLLVKVVQQRLRRNLSRGYQPRRAILPRVRGRIDLLETAAKQLLEQGRVSCRFAEHTMNTPRNQLVRAALDYLTRKVTTPRIANECRSLSFTLGRMGVAAHKPSRATLASDQLGRNETADVLMVSLAKMVFDVLIPSEQAGQEQALGVNTDIHLMRRLFERAVTNALRLQLEPLGWQVRHGRKLHWPVEWASDSIVDYLPGMQTDIELVHLGQKRKLVIDTKFNKIFSATQYRENIIRSGYLYQLYAYLRTQESESQAMGIASEGMLLHPQFGQALDAHIVIQGHRLRFKTIDLMASADRFESQLAAMGQAID